MGHPRVIDKELLTVTFTCVLVTLHPKGYVSQVDILFLKFIEVPSILPSNPVFWCAPGTLVCPSNEMETRPKNYGYLRSPT